MQKQENYIEVIREEYPQLNIQQTQLNTNGQFNDILIINGELVFRFPKYASAIPQLEAESAHLRALQEHLTLPIPNPIYHSRERTQVGRVFSGYKMIPGEPLWPETLQALDEATVQHLAEQVAGFLRQLHSLSAAELGLDLPTPEGNEVWADLYRRFRERLFPFMRVDARDEVVHAFEAFLGDARNQDYQPVLIHGDFGCSNILYDQRDQRITGIIDFSSISLGDPAVDIAALTCSVGYGEDFVKRFKRIYPDIDTLLPRTRFYTSTFALQEALYGIENNDQESFKAGIKDYI